jgi:hypothetical protein
VRRKTPPWYIEVAKKNKVLARLVVPAHKLPTNALAAFMKALVVRYLTSSPEEMLPFYVSRAKGEPALRSIGYHAEPIFDHKTRRYGYFFGDWECYATATYEVDREQADWIERERRRGR